MAGEWTAALLGEVCREIYRYPSFYGMERYHDGVPVVRGEHLLPSGRISTDWSDYWFVSEEYSHRFPKTQLEMFDVVMSVRGSIGTFAKVGSAHVGAQISPNLIRLSPDPERVFPAFFYYALRGSAATAFISSTSSSSAVPAIRAADIKLATIPLPPLPEQRAIAHILGTLDDKIELNRRMNETLEGMARALFKSWFVDFDPVRAKLALGGVEGMHGEQPAGLAPQIAALFPDELVETELGLAPRGWEVETIADLAEVSSGKRPNARYQQPSEIARIPLWGGNGPMAFVPKSLIDYPILLTGRVGTLGSVFRITEPCWPSDNTLIIRASRKESFEYLFFWLRTLNFSSLNRGSTQPLLTQTDLKAQSALVPSEGILDCFHALTKGTFLRMDSAIAEIHSLTSLRDTLLPRLISGELRVADAERIVGRSV